MGWLSSDKLFQFTPVWTAMVGPQCYLLNVDVPERSVLGSLSDPGIFQGPGETVAFLPPALPLLLLGWLGRLSPRPLSSSLGLGLLCSGSICCPPPLRSPSSLLLPLEFVCGSLEPLGDWVDSLFPLGMLLSPAFLSLDLPLELLEALGSLVCSSLPPSPSVLGCPLCPLPLWVDLPPSFLALPLPLGIGTLLPWPIRSGFSSSTVRGLWERSVRLSRTTGSCGTSRGSR